MTDPVNEIKKSIRSVLLSSKEGVRATRLQGEFHELVGGYIEYKKFGFSSLHEFLKSLNDVVLICKNKENETVYKAKADSSTQHIKQMVAKQRPSKKQKHTSSAIRHNFRPVNRKSGYYTPGANFSPVNIFTSNQKSWRPLYVNIKQGNSHNRSVHYRDYPKSLFQHTQVMIKPRFKKEKIDFTKDLSVTNFNNNPLNPSPITTKSKPTTFSVTLSKPHLPETATFKEKFTFLLNENKSGIYSENVNRMFNAKFGEDIPEKFLSKILDGNVVNLATLSKVTLGSRTKCILLPLKSVGIRTQTQKRVLPVIKQPKHIEHEAVKHVSSHEPLTCNNMYDALVVSVHPDQNKVFVNLVSASEQYRLMYAEIKAAYENSAIPKESDLVAGTYVISCLHQRGQVKSVAESSKTLIYNIDIGTTDYISSRDLRLMSNKIALYPEFAINCTFYTLSIKKTWNSKLTKQFDELYSECQLRIKIMQVLSNISSQGEKVYQHNVIFYTSGSCSNNINFKLLSEVHTTKVIDSNKFQPFPVQLPDEEYCDMFLIKAGCTTEIDACILGEGYSEELVKLETSMLKFYKEASNHSALPNPLKLDVIYAVMFEDACVRGKLISIENGIFTFYLVDSGDTDSIEVKQGEEQCIFALTKAFSQLPTQIITISLARLDNEAISMDSDILQHLADNYISHFVVAHVLTRGRINIVNLYDTSGDVDVNINQICYDLILEPKYLPVLPDFGNVFSCSITHINHDNNLLFLNCNGEGVQYLKKTLGSLMQESAQHKKEMPKNIACNLYPGKMCLAAFGKQYYRARIEQITDAKPRGIQAYLVDVGRFEKFSRGCLFKIANEELAKVPDQAICCKLTPSKVCSEGDGLQIALSKLTSGFNQTNMLIRLDNKKEDFFMISMWITYRNKKLRVVLDEDKVMTLSTNSEIKKDLTSNNIEKELCENIEHNQKDIKKKTMLFDNKEIKKEVLVCSKSDSNNNHEVLLSKNIKSVKNELIKPHIQLTSKDILTIEMDSRKIYGKFEWTLINIKVEDCISPSYICMICLHNIENRALLMEEMCRFYKRHPLSALKQSDLIKNELYAVSRNCNGKIVYDRAQVVNFHGSLTSVYYIDLGKCGAIGSLNYFFTLDKRFTKIPGVVMMAKLGGIEPVEGESWSENVNDRLKTMIAGKKYIAHVMAVSVDKILHDQKVYHVCLCDTSSGKDVWINDVIVDDWKVAKYTSSK